MCYFTIEIIDRESLRILDVQSNLHPDGAGYYCMNCSEINTDLRWIEIRKDLPGHFGHYVLVHLRRTSMGSNTCENVHPFQHQHGILAHNGTILDIDRLSRIPRTNGRSDSSVLAELASKRFRSEGYRGVMSLFVDAHRSDPKGNYVFISKKYIVVHLGRGTVSKKNGRSRFTTGGSAYYRFVVDYKKRVLVLDYHAGVKKPSKRIRALTLLRKARTKMDEVENMLSLANDLYPDYSIDEAMSCMSPTTWEIELATSRLEDLK